LLSNVLTESYDIFSLVFSPTLPIIQRSTFVVYCSYYILLTHNYRVLLVMICYLGLCPCPRCFIKKEHISGLGTKVDDQRRGHLRTENEWRQQKVDKSRSYIFEKGRNTNSTWVNDLLQEESWIPSRVRIILIL
jgi:hypothetical protein